MGQVCTKSSHCPRTGRGKMAFIAIGLLLNLAHVTSSGVAADFYSGGLSLPGDLEAALNAVSLAIAIFTVVSILFTVYELCAPEEEQPEAEMTEVRCSPVVEVSPEASLWTEWRISRSISADSALSVSSLSEKMKTLSL